MNLVLKSERLLLRPLAEIDLDLDVLPLPIEEDDTDWDLVAGEDLPEGEIEVGYLLKQSAWGKGYATEACTRMLRFAFEQTALQEVVAVTDPENRASQKVLRKCGLIEEGLRRAYAAVCPGFRITRRQWLERTRDGA
jgi:RimJ/RimL family protein N-acetyltransferase